MDKDKIIDGLRVTMEQIVFDPSTGKEYSTDILNDLDRKIYDACKGALEILERLDTDSDTISRRAAIDAVNRLSLGETDAMRLAIRIGDYLERLSPAQLGANLAEVGTDCISRQALLDKFEPWLKVKDYNDGELNMLKAVLYEIRFMRPAQPEPKRGKWIKISPANIYECSECGKNVMTNDICAYDFCHGCGAKMDVME